VGIFQTDGTLLLNTKNGTIKTIKFKLGEENEEVDYSYGDTFERHAQYTMRFCSTANI
jgi:hypothetical protein